MSSHNRLDPFIWFMFFLQNPQSVFKGDISSNHKENPSSLTKAITKAIVFMFSLLRWAENVSQTWAMHMIIWGPPNIRVLEIRNW